MLQSVVLAGTLALVAVVISTLRRHAATRSSRIALVTASILLWTTFFCLLLLLKLDVLDSTVLNLSAIAVVFLYVLIQGMRIHKQLGSMP
jgi:hypothetical protein